MQSSMGNVMLWLKVPPGGTNAVMSFDLFHQFQLNLTSNLLDKRRRNCQQQKKQCESMLSGLSSLNVGIGCIEYSSVQRMLKAQCCSRRSMQFE